MTPRATGSTRRRSTPLLSVPLAISFAACGDAPSASIAGADMPIPGDPAMRTIRNHSTGSCYSAWRGWLTRTCSAIGVSARIVGDAMQAMFVQE